MSLPLANKVALVTGSSRGIGAAIATRLASDGASVVVNYFGSKVAAEEVVQSINAEGKGKAVAIRADMSSLQDAIRLVEETVQTFGGLDVIVLNAAMMHNTLLETVTEELFNEHFQMNVKVPLFMVQAASKHLKTGGRVFFISSTTTKYSGVFPHYLLYPATKGAVHQLTRVLAKDLGARGITVNAIAPGPVDTEMFREDRSEEVIQSIANLHPAKRLGRPDEISPIVAFLSREEAGWVNGQTIFVNGASVV